MAQAHLHTVMVVQTHRKAAQPVTLGHYYMAIAENVGKSIERYEQTYARMNLNPLGSGASAGAGFPLDRQRTTVNGRAREGFRSRTVTDTGLTNG